MAESTRISNIMDVDRESLQLIIDLQRADIEEQRATTNGETRDVDVQDALIAAAMYNVELQSILDPDTNPAGQDQELVDRLMQEAASAQLETCRSSDTPCESTQNIDSQTNHNGDVVFQQSADQDTSMPERNCPVCGNAAGGPEIPMPCQDTYCHDCLCQLFQHAIKDDSLFPPKCCGQQVDFEIVQGILPPGIKADFEAKREEYETANKIYCSESHCAKFISPSTVYEDMAFCSACWSSTCGICKSAAHHGPCPEDLAEKATLKLAKEAGWRKCPECQVMIELTFGCNHMICRCGHQFCYVCGARWKTCSCAQWDRHRLLDRAAVLVHRRDANDSDSDDDNDNDHGDGDNDGYHEQRRMWRMMNHVVQRHDCTPHRWRRRDGSHQCDECNQTLPDFILECRRCLTMACVRCRVERIGLYRLPEPLANEADAS